MKIKKVKRIGKERNDQFLKQLKHATDEQDINPVYRHVLTYCLGDVKISSKYRTDGVFASDNHDLLGLMEVKKDQKLNDKRQLSKVLVQVIYYLHDFVKNGDVVPRILLIGDRHECFAMRSDLLEEYVNMDSIDWEIRPCDAYKFNRIMLEQIEKNDKINPYIFTFKENFDFSDVVNKLVDLNCAGPVIKIRVTSENVLNVFEEFCRLVLKQKLPDEQRVKLFVQLLIDPKSNFLNPFGKNVIHQSNGDEVKCDSAAFTRFFNHFDVDCTAKDKEEITRACDRLKQEQYRRNQGAFYTPDAWTKEAHAMLSEHLDKDWKKNYVVWDCCAGTGNLTADISLKELYVSSLKEEIDIQISAGINSRANRFSYDFVSEVGIDKVPEPLKEAFDQKKKVLFFINPPYGTAKNGSSKAGDSKKGMAKNVVNEAMLADGYGSSAQQLYANFLYKILQLKKRFGNQIAIGLFSPPLFLTGEHYIEFRKKFLKEFSFKYGMLFEAREFSDVAKGWGISFTIFE